MSKFGYTNEMLRGSSISYGQTSYQNIKHLHPRPPATPRLREAIHQCLNKTSLFLWTFAHVRPEPEENTDVFSAVMTANNGILNAENGNKTRAVMSAPQICPCGEVKHY